MPVNSPYLSMALRPLSRVTSWVMVSMVPSGSTRWVVPAWRTQVTASSRHSRGTFFARAGPKTKGAGSWDAARGTGHSLAAWSEPASARARTRARTRHDAGMGVLRWGVASAGRTPGILGSDWAIRIVA